MAIFHIDFSGTCLIEAQNADEAEEKFWNGLTTPSKETFDDCYDIECIEERKDS